ncbi:hypothetical protein H7F33_10265 [Pedobacter sp. PAMC26386]|nr:hypothetical protein H7F33_10265 [Pedobacter sp. PAMC26386]
MKKPNNPSSLKGQKAIDSINSKYTYNQICVFHETILRILGSSDLSCLKDVDKKSIEYFARTIVTLLDSPEISESIRKVCQAKITQNISLVRKIIPQKPDDYESKKSLYNLLIWINCINHKQRLTLEIILDDYYYHFPFSQSAIIMENYILQQTTSA